MASQKFEHKPYMRILFIAQRLPFPPNKGEKIRTFHQISFLTELRHTLTVFSPLHSPDEAKAAQAFALAHDVTVQSFSLPHKVLRWLKGILSGKPLSVANFYSAHLQLVFNQAISDELFDVIICTSSSLSEYVFRSPALRLQINKARPLLLMDFMDVDSDKWFQYARSANLLMKWVYGREGKLMSEYETRILANFDHCFLISSNEVELFQKCHVKTSNLHVLGNGIDTSKYYPVTHKHNVPGPIYLFVGVMDYKPNVDAVLWFVKNAWPAIIDSFPDARFIIAGMNPTQSVSNLAGDSAIEVTGFVDEILPYFHQADYFVAPFTIARGVQNKILQAFACGLPVIASPMGAEGIACTDGEHIMLALNGQDYLQATNTLENDPELKKSLISNALELIETTYSWKGQLEPLERIIDSLSEQSSQSDSD